MDLTSSLFLFPSTLSRFQRLHVHTLTIIIHILGVDCLSIRVPITKTTSFSLPILKCKHFLMEVVEVLLWVNVATSYRNQLLSRLLELLLQVELVHSVIKVLIGNAHPIRRDGPEQEIVEVEIDFKLLAILFVLHHLPVFVNVSEAEIVLFQVFVILGITFEKLINGVSFLIIAEAFDHVSELLS